MWNDFINYILNEVEGKKVTIAEIAVGHFDRVANTLSKNKNITLIKTDINPKDESIVKDDITNPDMELYKNVDIIYSIRPPGELQPYIIKLAREINAQLIIKPLTNEDLNTGSIKMKLKNYKKASFYTLR